MGMFGPMHWLIIGVIVLLLFGNRLPSVMRSLGLGVVEFKKGLQGIQEEMNNDAPKDAASKDAAKERVESERPENKA
jgi:sec-independent protein translocase protein TatA